jgi:hypothetical protein
MPDITMCSGRGCPKKDQCYRYKATPNQYWQSYFVEPPFGLKKADECEHFVLQNELEKRVERKRRSTKKE